MKRLTLTIHGNVQGVGFRAFVQRTAKDLSVGGQAWNEWDGTVKVVAEGDEEALRHLLAACHDGPAAATVEKIKEIWEEIEEATFDSFRIL